MLLRTTRKIVTGGMYAGRGAIFPAGKIASLHFLRPESEGFKQKMVGVAVAGKLASPSTGKR